MEFSKDLGDGVKAITQIQFYVSLLGNVCTIQIVEIEEKMEFHPFLKEILPKQILKEIWVSPDNHPYKDLFLKIQTSLEELFENLIYLPYSIQQIELRKIKLLHTDDNKKNTVGNAFFRKILPLYKGDSIVLGNQDYGIQKLT